ncbi:TetR family transcriptional regulator [Nakamurella endophytica]|uniref:TetR family transcriptional regulator n=1 Tax=Nakamurella endophytica TaxID=1748367 RepID=A0A917SVT1_9ACTN|nr:TetR family transcriptional regulator [Nakamurella endophytica]
MHDDELRERLLATAGRLITERGVTGLSLRVLAAEEGTSTTAVYSLFGGRTGLLTALFQQSFSSFGAAQRAVPVTDDAHADLVALGWAYRDWALAHPHAYRVMFGGALTGFEPTPQEWEFAGATIGPLREAVARAIRAGVVADLPDVITHSLWATVHGLVSLVLADCAPPDEQDRRVYGRALEAIVCGFAAPAGPPPRST